MTHSSGHVRALGRGPWPGERDLQRHRGGEPGHLAAQLVRQLRRHLRGQVGGPDDLTLPETFGGETQTKVCFEGSWMFLARPGWLPLVFPVGVALKRICLVCST